MGWKEVCAEREEKKNIEKDVLLREDKKRFRVPPKVEKVQEVFAISG